VKTDKVQLEGSCHSERLEYGSTGIAIDGTFIGQLLVKTLQAAKDLACALVICKVWKLVMAL
jgi:hypothetical protein